MTIDAITGLPTAPNRSQGEASYSATADAWAGDLDRWTNDLNTFGTEANAVGAQATADALTASNAQTSATASAITAAAVANFAGEWSTLTGALNVPASVLHDGIYWNLLTNLANVTTSEPGVTGDWDQLFAGPLISLTASGAITAGDMLTINSNETASAITGSDQSAGTPSAVTTSVSDKTIAVVAVPSTNVAVMFYSDVSGSSVGEAVAFEFNSSGAITSIGSVVGFSGGVFTTSLTANWDLLSSRIIVTYTPNPGFNSNVLSCSVTGVALSFGTVTSSFETNKNASAYEMAYDTVAQKHLCIYMWGTGGGNYGTVLTGSVVSTGFNPTFGTSVLFGSATMSAAAIAFSPTVAKFLMAYIDAGSDVVLQAATITGTVPSYSAEVEVSGTTNNNPLCAHRTNGVNDQFLVGWADTADNQIYLALYEIVAGLPTVITSNFATGLYVDPPLVDEKTMSLVYGETDDAFALVFSNNNQSDTGELRTVTIDGGNNIKVSKSAVIFASAAIENFSMAWSEDTNQFSLGYSLISNGFGTAAILKAQSGSLVHGEYAAVALVSAGNLAPVTAGLTGSVSLSQSGLTPGAQYYVEFDGSLGFTDTQPPAGIALSATKLLIKG